MRRGFTLIEVLIAAAITAVLATTVLAAAAGLARMAQARSAEARRDERRARAVELLAQDWKGRTRLLRAERMPEGVTAVAFSTTADALDGRLRSCPELRYLASERGLRREEGGLGVDLVEEPVRLEIWDGEAWRPEATPKAAAIRLTFVAPAESVVLR